MKTRLAAIVFLAGVVLTARAEVGTVSISTANTYSFTAAAGNLIAGLSPSAVVNGSAGMEGTGPVTVLTDGAIVANNANTYTVGNNAVLTYTLGDAEDGYDITGVNLYSGWGDSGRENLTVTSLAYSTPDDPTTFVAIPGTAVNYSGGTSIAVARYTATGGPIAEGVYALRINFGPQENNYVGYRELECIGVASAPLVAPPEIVTLPATNVTAASAWISGSLTSTGTAASAVIAYWGASDGDTNATAWANSTAWAAPQTPGDFTHPVSGLAADAAYYFRFAASNEVGTAWSESTLAFITGAVTLDQVSDSDEATLTPGIFRVSRPSATLGTPLTAFYEQTGGSAVSGTDFVPLSGSVEIPSDSLSADIAVTPINNWAVQADTTVELTLQPGGYLVGSPDTATLTITNRPLPTGSGTVHYVSSYGSDEPPYLTWATAARNPAAAVAVAATGDQVLVLSGTYPLDGEIPVTNAITIASVDGAATTILVGGGASRIFNMTANAIIDGFTLTNGVTTTGGGGVKMTAGTLRNCVLIKNSAGTTAAAGGGGGGVWMSGGLVHDCDITANTGRVGNDDGGGGVRLSGGTLSNCLVAANQAVSSGACGGGIALMKSTALAIDCLVTNNSSYYAGGGLWAYPGRAYRCRMIGNRVTNNSNGGGGGGLRDGGIIDSCIVTNNTGHGVYYRNGAVRDSLVAKNSSYGIYVYYGGTVDNCTIADNANVGVYLQGSGSGGTIRNNIIHGNSAIYGGGDLARTQWYNNLTPTEIPGGLVLSGNVVGDPLFVSAATGDYRVSANSPAIDAGMNLASAGIVVDISGTPRPTRNGYDIGCYEEIAPRVVNLGAVATASEAVLGGNLVFDGGAATVTTIYWGTTDGGTDKGLWDHAIAFDSQVSGAIYTATVGVSSAGSYYFRNAASNILAEVWAHASQHFISYSGSGRDRVWNGAGADNLASNGDNWEGGTAPQPGDGVVLDLASSKNMTWNAAAPSELARWVQNSTYAGTVTIETLYGNTGFTNLTIAGDCGLLGGSWTHAANSSDEIYRLRATINAAFTLGEGASILVDSKGYTSGKGPGAGSGYVDNSASATYGGVGGDSGTRYANRNTYGSIEAPVNLGSASGHPGGGAVMLEVTGVSTVDGLISANGGSGTYGCGSGGSILLETGSITGKGSLRANGGRGGYSSGGGGRIAIVLTDSGADFTNWTGTETAYGESGGGISGAGTLYRRAGAGGTWLIVDNNNIVMGLDNITMMPPGVNFNDYSNIVVRRTGVLGVRADTVLDFGAFNLAPVDAANSIVAIIDDSSTAYPTNWVIEAYTLRGDGISKPLQNLTVRNGGVLSTTASLNAAVRKLTLAIAGDLAIESTGSIGLDGTGYAPKNGPGASPSGGTDGAAGGTHGGIGGESTTKLSSKNTYGLITAPTEPGSGSGAYGGGAAILTVGGTTTVSGVISANGGVSTYGSAAGGSVFLTTAHLVGGGAIRANGGNGGSSSGGGGRVAVVLTDGDFTGWTGSITATGDSGGNDSAAGTVYLAADAMPPGYGTVIVDNKNIAKNTTFTPIPAYAASAENLRRTPWTARNKASLKLVANAVLKTLDMQSASYLDLAGKRLAVDSARINGQDLPPGEYVAVELDPAFVSDTVGGGSLFVRGRATHLIVR